MLRTFVIGIATFCAISAIGGGFELILWRHGNGFLPISLLDTAPFATFLVPGLILGVGIGSTSAFCAIFTWKRKSSAIDVTILAGGAMTLWIVAECCILQEFHWLHVLYGSLGVFILGAGLWLSWRSSVPRHRWIMYVTVAETVGFSIPIITGIMVILYGANALFTWLALVTAGFLEGLILGTGQALAFPFVVHKRRYAVLTGLAACTVWGAAMAIVILAQHELIPMLLGFLLAIGIAPLALTAMGFAQALELKRVFAHTKTWVVWTALAWGMALPISFAPGPFVNESTPPSYAAVLWLCAGIMMAYVFALLSWQGVRRLTR